MLTKLDILAFANLDNHETGEVPAELLELDIVSALLHLLGEQTDNSA